MERGPPLHDLPIEHVSFPQLYEMPEGIDHELKKMVCPEKRHAPNPVA